MLKDRLSKTRGWQFHKWLFGPEKYSGLSRNGPLSTRVNPNTLRIRFDGQNSIFESGKTKLQIQKYSDSCGRDLRDTSTMLKIQRWRSKGQNHDNNTQFKDGLRVGG